jgi:hypothetical protein
MIKVDIKVKDNKYLKIEGVVHIGSTTFLLIVRKYL